MPEKKTLQIDIQGQKWDVEEVSIKKTVREDFNVYELDDGAKLRMKTVVAKVYRTVGRWNELGEPVYLAVSNNIVMADGVPENLRKK